jgi:la-related protein 1
VYPSRSKQRKSSCHVKVYYECRSQSRPGTMSTTNSSINGDAVQSKGAFSYAQAAKGSSAPPTPSVQSAQEANGWSGEQSTSAEDQSRDQNLATSKTSDAGSSSTSSTKDDKAATSSVASDLVASSVLPAKDEDDVSDVTSPSEVGQGQASKEPTSGAQTPEVSVEKETGRGRKNKKSKQSAEDKAEQAEKPAPIPMKEAPVPTVNIWQQRAQQAKTSQPSLSPTATERSSPTSSTQKSSAQGTPTPPVRAASFPRGDETPARTGPLPPRNDETSWPTPISAEDEARKRAQELADKEKAHTATAKPHGKSEWKAVPYTPTVKFNTPLPALRGKGGKPGARGGRVEGATGRSPVVGQNGTGAETAEFKPRSKSEGGVARSATLPSNSRRPESQGGAKTEAMSSDTVVDSSLASHAVSQAASSAKDTPAAQDKSAATHIETASNGVPEVNGTTQINNISPESATGVPPTGRQRRRSQSGQTYEHTNGERKQRGSENGPSGDRSWIENRERSKGENYTGPYRGDGTQRGRGGYKAGRGAHAQGIHPGMAQHGLPPVQTIGHHNKNFSGSYYQPTGMYAQAGRGAFRGGRASMPADGNFGRYGYGNGQQFGDYPYPVAAYGYPGMVPMSAFPYAPQMEQQVLVSAISMQM